MNYLRHVVRERAQRRDGKVSSDDPRKTTAISTGNVVLVAASTPLFEVVKQAATQATRADVRHVPLAKINTAAATLRPYAIVVEPDTYEFAGGDLDALARDVGAVLVTCTPSISPRVLRATLEDALARARR